MYLKFNRAIFNILSEYVAKMHIYMYLFLSFFLSLGKKKKKMNNSFT